MGRDLSRVLKAASVILVLFLGTIAIDTPYVHAAAVTEGKPLVIQFDKGQNSLKAADRNAIRRLLSKQKPGPGKQIVVLGHSDSRGNPKKNMQLSQQRAETVRKEILRVSGAEPQHVLAMGRGAENPVASNHQRQGRARNRRVEIYWKPIPNISGKPDNAQAGVSQTVAAMIQDARNLIRRRQLIEAVRLLEQARTQGGEGDSHWQAVYGIAGFYAGMDARIVRHHLGLALEKDPFNQEARDYSGRIMARERVADGSVNSQMGQNDQDPIAVSSDAQVHEYLQLFDVQPFSKQRSLTRPIEAWYCRDRQGRQVVYYFDRSQIYTWAFARNGSQGHAPSDSGMPQNR